MVFLLWSSFLLWPKFIAVWIQSTLCNMNWCLHGPHSNYFCVGVHIHTVHRYVHVCVFMCMCAHVNIWWVHVCIIWRIILSIFSQMPSTYSYFLKKIFVVFLIVWFWVWYMHTWAQIQHPEEALGSLELELQVIMNNLTWELGTELESLQTDS